MSCCSGLMVPVQSMISWCGLFFFKCDVWREWTCARNEQTMLCFMESDINLFCLRFHLTAALVISSVWQGWESKAACVFPNFFNCIDSSCRECHIHLFAHARGAWDLIISADVMPWLWCKPINYVSENFVQWILCCSICELYTPVWLPIERGNIWKTGFTWCKVWINKF